MAVRQAPRGCCRQRSRTLWHFAHRAFERPRQFSGNFRSPSLAPSRRRASSDKSLVSGAKGLRPHLSPMAGIDAIYFPDQQRLRQRTSVLRPYAPEWSRLDVCAASIGIDVISSVAEPGNTSYRPDDGCSTAMTDSATLTPPIKLRGVSVFAGINLHPICEAGWIAGTHRAQ